MVASSNLKKKEKKKKTLVLCTDAPLVPLPVVHFHQEPLPRNTSELIIKYHQNNILIATLTFSFQPQILHEIK